MHLYWIMIALKPKAGENVDRKAKEFQLCLNQAAYSQVPITVMYWVR